MPCSLPAIGPQWNPATPRARLSEIPGVSAVKPDQDSGATRTGSRTHVVGYLLDYPQAVTGLALQRAPGGPVPGARLRSHRDAIVVSSLSGGWRQITVVNLAMQCTRQVPHPQPPGPAAMPDGVRRQLMHGQDHILNPGFRKPGVTGTGPYPCPHHTQRVRFEPQINDRWGAVSTCLSRPPSGDPAAIAGRFARTRAISHELPEGQLGKERRGPRRPPPGNLGGRPRRPPPRRGRTKLSGAGPHAAPLPKFASSIHPRLCSRQRAHLPGAPTGKPVPLASEVQRRLMVTLRHAAQS